MKYDSKVVQLRNTLSIGILLLLFFHVRATPTDAKNISQDSIYKRVVSMYRSNQLDKGLHLIDSMLNSEGLSEYNDARYRKVRVNYYTTMDLPDSAMVDLDYMALQNYQEDSLRILFMSSIAYYNYKTENYIDAVDQFQETADLYFRLEKYEVAFKNITLKAVCQSLLNLNEDAILTLQEAETAVLSSELSPDITNILLYRIYNGIALSIRDTEDFAESNHYLEKALMLNLDSQQKSIILGNLASGKMYEKDYIQAINYGRQVLRLEPLKKSVKNYALQDIVRCHISLARVDSAAHYFRLFEGMITDKNSSYYKDDYNSLKGELEYAKGNYRLSLSYLKEAYAYVNTEHPYKLRTIESISKEIMKAHAKLYPGIEDDFNNFIADRDTVNKVHLNSEVNALHIKYETARKELDNQILLSENKTKDQNIRAMSIGGTLIFSLVGSLLGLLWFRNKALRQDQQLLQMSTRQLEYHNLHLSEQLQTLERNSTAATTSDKKRIQSVNISDDLTLMLPQKDETIRIKLNDIIYVKSARNYIDIFIKGRPLPITYRATLKGFCGKWLPEEIFLRIHKSHVVNRNYIESYELQKMTVNLHAPYGTLNVGKTYSGLLQELV